MPSLQANIKLPIITSFVEIILIGLNNHDANPICVVHEPGAVPRESTTMNHSVSHGSAKIYQFPVKVSGAVEGRRDEAKTAAAIRSPRVHEAAVGGCWYHEEAIREAEGARKQ
jgi:hypothetical protein